MDNVEVRCTLAVRGTHSGRYQYKYVPIFSSIKGLIYYKHDKTLMLTLTTEYVFCIVFKSENRTTMRSDCML